MGWAFIIEIYCIMIVVVSDIGSDVPLKSRFEIAITDALRMTKWFVKC